VPARAIAEPRLLASADYANGTDQMVVTGSTVDDSRQDPTSADATGNADQSQPTGSVDLVNYVHDRQSGATYESIERLLQDTTTHSAELVWRIMAMPEMVKREAAKMQADAADRIQNERERQRSVLRELLEELSVCRRRAETLGTEVADLLGDLGRWSERATAALADIDALTQPPAEHVEPAAGSNGVEEPAGEPELQATVATPIAATEDEATGTDKADTAWWESDLAATLNAVEGNPDGSSGDGAGEEPEETTDDSDAIAEEYAAALGGRHGFSLVVHGARPTAALSLRSYLSSLNHVSGVVVRDYAADELHAQLSVSRPLRIDDFEGWNGNIGITVVSAGDDAMELQLGAATGD
jgi:hypothetical protein